MTERGAAARPRFPLGIVHVAFKGRAVPEAAAEARALGFDHIDVPFDWSGELALPVGDRMAFPAPRPGASVPAPPRAAGAWD
ncbi:MAG: hypothetical protein ACREQ9_17120, partial [Candidatus Binatia bacterium]